MTGDALSQVAEFVGGPKCGERMPLQLAHPALTFASLRDTGRYVQTTAHELDKVSGVVRIFYRWVPA